MKTVIQVIFFIFITTSTLWSQDWNTIKTFTQTQTINDILFVNDSTAYAVSALYNGTALNVKKTTDGGITWEEQYTGQTSNSFKEIASPNNGDDVFIVGNYGILIHTNDGGANWNDINIGTTENLRDIFFLSTSIGYICADGATIFKTIDGGLNWTDINAQMSGVNTIGQIYFLDEDRGYIAGFNFFKESFDGGLNWSDVPGHEPAAGVLFQIQDIQFIDDYIGYISGDVGLLYKTTDGGVNWIDKQVIIPGNSIESLFSINFLESNTNIGFACGYHGLLIRTYDAGESWELMSSDISGTNTPNGATFSDMDFWGDRGFMVGQHGEILEYEYIDTTNISISEYEIEDNSTKLFPNPVKDILTFVGLDDEIDQVQIFDITGKSCKVINNPVGNNIDCRDLLNGYYILKINSKGNIISKAFVKN